MTETGLPLDGLAVRPGLWVSARPPAGVSAKQCQGWSSYLQLPHLQFNRHRWKIFRKKKTAQQKLIQIKPLHSNDNYWRGICVVLAITGNLEMTWSIWEDVCRLHANTAPFYIRTWAFSDFGTAGSPETSPSWGSRDDCLGWLLVYTGHVSGSLF